MQASEHRKLWRERVELWRNSGLSQRACGLRQEWPTRQTNYWICKLSSGATSAAPGLVRVALKLTHIEEPAPAIKLHGGSCRVEIAIGRSPVWPADLLRRLP
jgi:hypothetical protein